MAKESYITGLDIGTSHMRAVQGKVNANSGKCQIIGASEVPSFGLRKGVVIDIEEAVSCISTALERVERMTGVPVGGANISISGSHISSQNSHGVIAVSRADGEITQSDIVRVVYASQAISIPSNREVLHVFPKSFTLQEALVEIEVIRQDIHLMAGNDSEYDELDDIIGELKSGKLTPEASVAKANLVKSRKNVNRR